MRIIIMTLVSLIISCSSLMASPEIVLNIPEYKLRLMDGTLVVKEYEVAVGTHEDQTPIGKFAVTFKEVNPTWIPTSKVADKTPVPPGPKNPLGRRWIEFAPAYGIHGTHKLWTVEYPISRGCVRMYNPDVEELFELVTIGTPVRIVYETISFVEKNDGLYVRIFPDIYKNDTTSQRKYLAKLAPFKKDYLMLKEPVWPVNVAFAKVYELKIGVHAPPR